MSKTRNTDVPGSIAGYYYQLLIACKELSILSSQKDLCKKDGIAIEKGSDVKIYKQNGSEISIEAKFYKNDAFSKSTYAIQHTLYNFYINFFQGNNKAVRYVFSTNVSSHVDDMSFFQNWPTNLTQDLEEYISYIKQCIVFEHISNKKSLKFSKYIEGCKLQGKQPANDKFFLSYYSQLLLEDFKNGKEKYEDYCEHINDAVLKEFVIRVEFNFACKCKFDEIMALKETIYQNINKYDGNLTNDDCNIIMNSILDKIFFTSITREVIYVEDFINEIEIYTNNKQEYKGSVLFNDSIKELLETIEQELERIDNIELDDYGKNDFKNKFIGILEEFSFYIEYKLDNDNEKVKSFIGQYSLDVTVNPIIITNLSRLICILLTYGGYENNSNILVPENIKNISNIIFDGSNEFCFKETESTLINTTEGLIGAFIKDTWDSFRTIKGNEIVVFSPRRFKKGRCPCDYLNSSFKLLPSNIGNVSLSIKLNKLYSSLDYRCNECLEDWDSEAELKEKMNLFKGGCRWKK